MAAWIRDLLSRLPTDIKASVAFPIRASFDDFNLPPLKKAKIAPSSSKASVKDLPVQTGKIVYEVVSPSQGQPSIELVFFHGLQLKGSQESQEAHLDTWCSEDGKELWLNWILDEDKFPKARILTISYDAHAEKTEKDGQLDFYITAKNLVQDLTQAGVGQNRCPVVLIGHCIGGLVMKEICVSATEKVVRTCDILTQPIQNFLGNIKGLFFYGTPHCGTKLAENKDFTNGCLFEDTKPLNTEAARQREKFCALRQKNRWRTYGMVETYEVTLGKFKGLIVPEASARCDMDDFYTAKANHFNICKPAGRTSPSFINLISFIKGVVKETEGQIRDEEPVHQCTGLPTNPVEVDTRAQDIQNLLEGGAVLGLFSMGGIGKTTLAKKVFNNISKDFEYTCFVDNVKGFTVNDLRKSVPEHFHCNGIKLDGAKTQWSQMKGKKTLIVMDDTDSVDQLAVLPPWQDYGNGSCLIITGRNKGVFKFYVNCIVYEVQLLQPNEGMKLFCKHAFGSEYIPKDYSEHSMENVHAVVRKCSGLPLTLEVMGRYLQNEKSITVWEETIDNLQKAIPIDGGQNEDDKVWATLELSYNKLSKEAQEMFCDAATFFFEQPLDEFLFAWSGRCATTTWKNLVDRAMVKGSNHVWVHEQLRDMAKKVAKETMLYGAGEDGVNSLVDQLNAKKVNANIKGLRLINRDTPGQILRVDFLVCLEQLKYVEIVGVLLEGEGKGLLGKLRLLKCYFPPAYDRPSTWSFQITLINMNDLAVLELENCVFPKDFHTSFGDLVNLRSFLVKNCDVPEGFYEAMLKWGRS